MRWKAGRRGCLGSASAAWRPAVHGRASTRAAARHADSTRPSSTTPPSSRLFQQHVERKLVGDAKGGVCALLQRRQTGRHHALTSHESLTSCLRRKGGSLILASNTCRRVHAPSHQSPHAPQQQCAWAQTACRATAPTAACLPLGCAQQTRLQHRRKAAPACACRHECKHPAQPCLPIPPQPPTADVVGVKGCGWGAHNWPQYLNACPLACVVGPAPDVARDVSTPRLVVPRQPGQLNLAAAVAEGQA